MDYFPQLLSCKLFSGLKYAEIENLLVISSAFVKTYKKSDLIIRAGEFAPGIAIVLEGSASISHTVNSSSDGAVETINESEVFGAAYVIKNEPVIVSVRAITEVKMMFLKYDYLTKIHSENYNKELIIFLQNLLPCVADKVLILAQKLEYMHLPTLKAKVAAYFLNIHTTSGLTEFSLPISRTRLAEYLGVSRSSMMREVGEMKKAGIIDVINGVIILKDIETIQDIFNNC